MGHKKTALMVDDEPSILKNYKFALSNRGYKVETAMTLEQAKKYSGKGFDLAIIDGLRGACFEVYNIINAKRKFIFTGDTELFTKAKEKGIEAHIKTESLGYILK